MYPKTKKSLRHLWGEKWRRNQNCISGKRKIKSTATKPNKSWVRTKHVPSPWTPASCCTSVCMRRSWGDTIAHRMVETTDDLRYAHLQGREPWKLRQGLDSSERQDGSCVWTDLFRLECLRRRPFRPDMRSAMLPVATRLFTCRVASKPSPLGVEQRIYVPRGSGRKRRFALEPVRIRRVTCCFVETHVWKTLRVR